MNECRYMYGGGTHGQMGQKADNHHDNPNARHHQRFSQLVFICALIPLSISGCHKSGADSSEAPNLPKASPDNWVCNIDENKTDIGCKCGDYIIPIGTQCVNEQPACNGKPVENPISGFGCGDEKEGHYVCRFSWGCLAGDLVCHEGQIFKEGKCINTETTKQSNQIEYGKTCENGDCLCGSIFCPKGSECWKDETTGKDTCICGMTEIDCCRKEGSNPIECVDGRMQIDGHMQFCKFISQIRAEVSFDGLFSCQSNNEGYDGTCVKRWGFICERPGGCYEDKIDKSSHRHFVKGAKDYSFSLPGIIYNIDKYKNNDNVIVKDTGINIVDDDEYGRFYGKRCPYHIDGIYDVEETLCGSGDCVIPMEHGVCGLMDIHTGSLTNNGGDSYDPVKCIGGTRYCHGKNNTPIIAPEESDGYLCAQLFDKQNPRRPEPRPGIKAWVCRNDSCICGGESCLKDMVCYNEKCISQEQVPDKNGNVSEAQNQADYSDVQLIEYNEYKVTGTRNIILIPQGHTAFPTKIELKVRCAVDNPEQCECIDSPARPYSERSFPRIISCDKKIPEVTNIHKHGTIDSFEKLLKYVKQSPEKHQYAISYTDFKPDDDPHDYNSLARLNRLNLDIQAVKTRKLCPVQDGVISEDCDCFAVESHDPSSFLVTNGIHTECPKTK